VWSRDRCRQVTLKVKLATRAVTVEVSTRIHLRLLDNSRPTDCSNGTDTAFRITYSCWLICRFILLPLRTPLLVVFLLCKNRNPLNYLLAVKQNQTNPVSPLRYGFEWVNPNATISVDLNLQEPDTAKFLEFLYFTWVYRILFSLIFTARRHCIHNLFCVHVDFVECCT